MTATEPHPAFNHRCPFCHADPAEACRTNRGRGHDLAHPHSRRIALARPPEERRLPKQVSALCCDCGNQRTVSSDYRRHNDPNYSYSASNHKDGWRCTQTLKCEACGARTRHALLRPEDGLCRSDIDEAYQRYALGGEWDGKYPPDRERLRVEYFAQFPRNPYAHHWYVVDEAQAAWDAGERTVISLCGEPMELKRDPKKARGRDVPMDELVEPTEAHPDQEYEDPNTGLWWWDMDCVNCLRVTNERRLKRRRENLEALLAWFARHPERIPDDGVDALMRVFTPLAETLREEG